MILPAGTTVAVADGETFRMFHNTGVKPGVHLVEITAAPPAHLHAGSGARHHTGSANPDGRRFIEEDFAAATAAFLNKLSMDGTIEHLVVVSDPRTLGEMRKHFHHDLRSKIIGELAKDFGRRPLSDIASLIAGA
ncbi:MULTISPECIES: baeRF12 domain-containing protein [Bradyrhizobium]|jgi:protein required for attachment to host cells|uniref:baeRF12 domain-containing protein n=1 Tax=Bradyrhizobium TaxID=374 RepID=UPI0004808700|nr:MULTISPECIES: host attachment protein [Bradyrhizobium]MCS3446049.1 protein required for attachment to host cells [Bradyrhizobium elkanii]MCS3562819.1 protein required for attachment to host cells [Bradyrhizobium elkanii]MCW2147345.1 protein required for attachment to host cells [Bradyrhizobium elkanii]MCW2353576.1 protein required for attachment to host cells [Bradyrhizobium elkanii]MCW2380176.1 protein required for attachment to host cells [Bradyrhizobium elkanii]